MSITIDEAYIYSTERVEDIRQQLQPIIEAVIKPIAARPNQEGVFPRESLEALAKGGFNSVLLPEKLGGLDLGYVGLTVIAEEIGKVDASTGLVYAMHVGATILINRFGTEQQKKRWLAPVRDGAITTFAISERASGGHVWYNFSQAERVDDFFKLNLEKSFVTSGGHADFYVVKSRKPDTEDPSETAYFIVNGHQEGITAGPWNALGVRSNHSGSLKLENILVHETDVVTGDKIEISKGTAGLLGLNAVWIGVAQAALDAASAYLMKVTHQDNAKRLADYQVLRQKLAEIKVQISAARAWQYSLARQADVLQAQQQSLVPLDSDITELKVFVTELADRAAHTALDVTGGYGYIEGVFERLYRDARGGIPMAPSNNLARELIGKGLLNIPLDLFGEQK